MRKILFLTALATLGLFSFSGLATKKVNTPNAAAAYCVRKQGQYSIRQAEKGDEYGVCVFGGTPYACGQDICFKPRSECEEWDFYTNRCNPGSCIQVSGDYDAKGNLVIRCHNER